MVALTILWLLAQLLFWCALIVLSVAAFLAVAIVPPFLALRLLRNRWT